MADSTVKAVVLADSLGYYETEGDASTRVDYDRGDEVTLRAKDFARHERDGAVRRASDKPAGYPTTQKALDAFAADNDFVWPDGTKTVADKVAALEAAGIEPDPTPEG